MLLNLIVCPLLFLYFKVREKFLSWDISHTCCFLFLLLAVPDFFCLWWNWSPKRLGVSRFLIFVLFLSLNTCWSCSLWLKVVFLCWGLVSYFLHWFWFSSMFCWFCVFVALSFVIISCSRAFLFLVCCLFFFPDSNSFIFLNSSFLLLTVHSSYIWHWCLQYRQ